MKMSARQKRMMSALSVTGFAAIAGCASFEGPKVVPALEYARSIGGGERQDKARAVALMQSPEETHSLRPKTAVHLAHGQVEEPRFRYVSHQGNLVPTMRPVTDTVSNMDPQIPEGENFQMHRSETPNSRDYNGPLSLGDPGVSASLWQESRGETSLFHDFRAWQPMDIITINVVEKAQGKKQADTNLKTESTFQAAINNIFGYENDVKAANQKADGSGSKVDLANLINASTDTEFKGSGQTGRTDTLTAQISAMVVEVLPGGVLRIEGERIVSMNNEEQIMVISGLARTRDISSENQIESTRIANLRVDYFGRGSVGSANYGGWLSNILRIIWPF